MSINQIQPQKNFAFVRQLPDPSDSTTYYVRAEIRYAETDTLIARVNLTDKGNRRFVGIWHAIADTSGQGILISVRSTVYTDSGYSVQSTNYAEEMETYIVMEVFNPRSIVQILGPALFERNMGGADVDYKKIRKIVFDTLEKELSPLFDLVEEIKNKKISIPSDLARKEDLIQISSEIVSSLPEQKEPDLSKISTAIASFRQEVIDALATIMALAAEKPEMDLSPVANILEEIKRSSGMPQDILQKFTDLFENKMPGMHDLVDRFTTHIKEKAPQEILPEDPYQKRSRELLNVAPNTGAGVVETPHELRAKEIMQQT